ncbi:PH domain-containing protein [Mycolicibacterium sp. S2-37]|uniref:PH domain-containing protein n=1 Tax=Mycolicibacterium sp. S2-37 TaxID=2810297 RepID=UPI001A950A48|nr:PH domain-containing protein [Mycolicibacterium sp. S2-37]MBO0681494.1 PH domain-containing protein [Mycolicibacterium sp. S2-37]
MTVALSDPTHRPSPKAPLVWAISAALPWGAAVAAQIAWWVMAPTQAWLHAAAAVATLLGVLLSVAVAPVWRYRVHRWDLDDRALYTRTGWLMQERRIAPISRVQTVDTHRGPLDRLFGLANVTVTTASSAGAVRVMALDAEVADRLVARLTDIAALGDQDAT